MKIRRPFYALAVAAVAATLSFTGTAVAQAAPLGPCNSPQAIKFSTTGSNGGTSTIQNCFSTTKKVAFRVHNVVFPVAWDQNGACQSVKPGAKITVRNAIDSYAFGYVNC
jgi:hypothetical protein